MEETSKNLFLTGKAGTGKSTLLDHFRENTGKRVAILAPTGVAAVNIEGETIHSFFGLKPNFELEEAKRSSKKPKNPRLYERLEAILIDEISMVRADLLDAIDIFLRNVRKSDISFGGVQMIFIGDLYQLPPVVTGEDRKAFMLRYQTPFFFGSVVFEKGDFDMEFIELDKIYRQSDQEFIRVLNAIRTNAIEDTDVEILNKQVDETFEPKNEDFVYLMTTNKEAKAINETKLAELTLPESLFEAEIFGEVKPNLFPADTDLLVKIGAQVMFLNNDATRRWVNGTIGKITDINEDENILKVETTDGNTVEVSQHTWEISKYVLNEGKFEREIIGSFFQFPIRLSWAITIHKSQGKTFDNVIIDMGRGSFAHGQTYVALSRCRTLEGIIFRKPMKKSHVIMDYRVRRFLTDYQYVLAEKALPFEEKIAFLEQSAKEQRKVKMIYLKGKDERSEREILPICVEEMEFKGVPFIGLKARCLMRGSERVFNVKRILEVEDI